MGLYLLGVLVAVFTARLLRRFYFHADETPFVMELPPYRIPTLKSSLIHMWSKGEKYLKRRVRAPWVGTQLFPPS